MTKEEIQHLTKLQGEITDLERGLEKAHRGIGIKVHEDNVWQQDHPELYEMAQNLITDYFTTKLSEKAREREELIICKGQAEYKPVNILE